MTIARVLASRTPDHRLITAAATDLVHNAVGLLAANRIGALPVLDGQGRVAGVFSERDVVYGVAQNGAAFLTCPLSDVMTSPAITVTPDTRVIEALGLMTQRRIRHLPVIAGGRMIGFVSIGDLVKYRIDNIESEAQALKTYIQSA